MCDGGMGQPQVGSTYYLTSFELYPHFKPNGNDRGHNLVCVSSKPELFVGFSDLFKTGPKSRAAILKELWQGFASKDGVEFNKEKHGQMVSAFLGQPGLFEKYCAEQQAKLPGPQYIDGDKVVEVVKKL